MGGGREEGRMEHQKIKTKLPKTQKAQFSKVPNDIQKDLGS